MATRVTHGRTLTIFSRGLTSLSKPCTFIPSFAPISRRFDHALSLQKAETSESHDTGALKSDTVSESTEAVSQPAFATLRTKVTPDTLRAITTKPFNHVHMSSVQAAVLPLLPELARPYNSDESPGPPRDLLVKAKTGTGKTLAFLVPAIETRLKAIDKAGLDALEKNGGHPDSRVVEDAKRNYARKTVGTVVISPTRELATQIAHEATKLTYWHKGFEVKLFTGGSSKGLQLREFKRGRNDIVVATPGRIRDVLENEPNVAQVLKTAPLLVLDEADTLLDMGFRPDIDAIADFFPKTPIRQTFLFSATVSPQIRQVAREVLDKNHTFIDVVPKDSSPVHAHIPQNFTVLPNAGEQLPHLFRLIAHDQLANPGKSKIIVFLNTTKQTQLFATLSRELSRTTLPARSQIYEIHSKRTQSSRTAASNAFRRDRSGASILVTSDVSARGVDYPDVTRVIQVGSPVSTEQYIHRVGRTGRAGKGGRADLILLPLEQNFARYQLSNVPIKELPHDKLLKETVALADELENDPATFWRSVKAVNPSANAFGSKDRQFRDKPGVALANLSTEISGLLDQADTEAIEEVFVSLLGYYFAKASDMRVTRRSIYEGLQTWATEACGLPKPPHVSDSLLAKMGGLDGGPPARSAQRGPLRRNFGLKAPATRYANSERNRQRNEWTDHGVSRPRRWEEQGGAGAGSYRSGWGSRSSRDGERRDGEWRDGERRKSSRSGWSRNEEGPRF
ncbi:P-loop containing nucleoside triphosphate hydrolase protein [Multifurca ochricompacta]|uniref:ATP-dependent RNA helicase n=1 Tax=Multifurca ochricompacta TaxID=376703 RepID=A0AAD4QQD7_9AGAM|nr:P-loop containing nucleoside triphosphate hydrolase protein [Multifurca ochricompacta]